METEPSMELCPAQQNAFKGVLAALTTGSIIRLRGGVGRGKTTVLQRVRQEVGGAFLTMRDFVEASAKSHPLALEETFHQLILNALQEHEVVLVDDAHMLDLQSIGCRLYLRSGYINPVMMAVCTYVLSANKKLVLSATGPLPEAAEQRCYSFVIDRFAASDYATLVANWCGADAASRLDFSKIHRFAPKLNGHQLKAACLWLERHAELNTDIFIEYLRSQRLASNVDLGEVQACDLNDLKGVDDVLRNLEVHIILPLENDAMASQFQLRSKRGVLLYGPPGTGKTTVGRALAHRLKSKFFLIDGTFISGTENFYDRVHQVFEAAKENAPSVIFIDDADSLFEDGEEHGLYRYLLTTLDGLESESAGKICVMMTAMNVAHLPPALVRSGRVELWLEMKLPDETARGQILTDLMRQLPQVLQAADLAPILAATEGFTGADLKRMVEDGKALYAYDIAKGIDPKPVGQYFLAALESVRENKKRYSEAEAQAAARPKSMFGSLFPGLPFPMPDPDKED